jgi:hypothetical protein
VDDRNEFLEHGCLYETRQRASRSRYRALQLRCGEWDRRGRGARAGKPLVRPSAQQQSPGRGRRRARSSCRPPGAGR